MSDASLSSMSDLFGDNSEDDYALPTSEDDSDEECEECTILSKSR